MTTPVKSDSPVYLTGNFNDWQVRDERFRMRQIEGGRFHYAFNEVNALPPVLEYKYVRGDWDGEELDLYGNTVSNRKVSTKERRVADQVPRWKNGGLTYRPDLLPETMIISEQFEIPQLIKTRRIAALLPHDYHQTTKRYPVLYLQDGQNLFDDYAPFGNWAVDKKLAVMSEKGMGDMIVIAIDHAAEERIKEFTPSAPTRLGKGDGQKYVRFLAETLKNYVDQHFRTLPQREFNGLGGSSMGGLISIYGGLMYPQVFSKLLIFSPALWVAPNIHFHSIDFGQTYDTMIYIYGGGDESVNMIPNIKRFKQAVEESGQSGNITIKLAIDPNGKHNEHRWGEEFPKAAEWLFFNHAFKQQK